MDVREILLVNWDEVLRHFESLPPHWLFRGQLDARWELRTTLERHTPEGMLNSDAERRLLHEFQRRAHLYLPGHHIPKDGETGEWLALMQHHGAPTRLLDVTKSPYVATYFAIEDCQAGIDCCAVWAVYRHWLFAAAGDAQFQNDPSPQLEDRGWWRGAAMASLEGDQWLRNHTSVVTPFEPERLSDRLSVQQGEFLVPHDVDKPFMENLAGLGDAGDKIIKYIIPVQGRGRILERLRMMNLTRAQLFPGLDGFAQSFRQLLLEEPQQERLERIVFGPSWIPPGDANEDDKAK